MSELVKEPGRPAAEAFETFEQYMCGRPWRIRLRGDVGRTANGLYRCRSGHEFLLGVSLSLVPDEVPCRTAGCRSSAQHILWKGEV